MTFPTEAESAVLRYLAASKPPRPAPEHDLRGYAAFKRYPDSPRTPLPWRRRAASAGADAALPPALIAVLGSYAPSRIQWLGWSGTGKAALRRAAPSGGAYYPGELYVVAAGDESPAGVYHYDSLHHALELLRRGDHRPAVSAALGGVAVAPATILVACRPWKNTQKYDAFGYRLGCLDLGFLTGHLLAAAPVPASVSFWFVDDVLDGLLGLDPTVEIVYAAVQLMAGDASVPARRTGRQVPWMPPVAAGLELDERAATVVQPVVAVLSEGSRAGTLPAVRNYPATPPSGPAEGVLPLPARARAEPREGIRRRRSAASFEGTTVDMADLSGLLRQATSGYPSDVDGGAGASEYVALYCVAAGVNGLPPAVYRYDSANHALVPGPSGSVCEELRAALLGLGDRLRSAPVSIFVTGSYAPALAAEGSRWYRILNMMAGITAQRACLAAAAVGLGCRPNLGFLVDETDRLLGLPPGQTSLVNLLVGHSRARPGVVDIPLF